MSINRTTLSGNLTRDAELRKIDDSISILSFGMAWNERRHKPDSDEWEEIPQFIDCAIFGNRAEALAPYLVKGTKVAVDGRLHYGQWEAEDGTRRSKHELIVGELEFLSTARAEEAEEEFEE